MSTSCDIDPHSTKRQELLSGTLGAVQGCQVRFGGRTELAIETDERVAFLCTQLEATLSHGLKPRPPNKGLAAIKQVTGIVTSGLSRNLGLPGPENETPVLWWYVRELLTRHEYERFLLLKNVTTDVGRGRAWLRSLLNEHSLERYMHIVVCDEELLLQWYEPWALLRHQEMAAMLPNLAAGLDSILFAINIDNGELNGGCQDEGEAKPDTSTNVAIEPEAVLASTITLPAAENDVAVKRRDVRKKKKKIPSQLISFDDDYSRPDQPDIRSPLYHSAPTTCLSSPTPTTATATSFADRLEKYAHLRELEQAKEALKREESQKMSGEIGSQYSAKKSQKKNTLTEGQKKSSVRENQYSEKNSQKKSSAAVSEKKGGVTGSHGSQYSVTEGQGSQHSVTKSQNSEDREGEEMGNASDKAVSKPISPLQDCDDFEDGLLAREKGLGYDDESFHERSYQQLFENILPKQTDFSPESNGNNVSDGNVGLDNFVPVKPQRPNSIYDQETGSYKSNQSNLSADSFPSSDGDGGTVFTPVGRNSACSLIPVSPRGFTAFTGSRSDDENSILSYSQEVDEAAMAVAEMVEGRGGAGVTSPTSVSSTQPSSSSGDTSTLTLDELKSAVLEISRARDAAECRRAEVAAALTQEMETTSMLRAEIAMQQNQHQDTLDKLNTRLNALTRENELLKHQLKKYVGAVQLLRRQESQDGVGPAVSRATPDYRDYHHEATAYEKKLIQVAEMHGELMEFNERLHKLLRLREAQVRNLRQELVDLRGPLPDTNEEEEEEELVSGRNSERDVEASPITRILINIWIPTAFLTGSSTDTHHVYQIYIRIKDDEWNIYRRFAQFYELHKHLKKKDPIIKSFDFPQKKTFGYKDEGVVEERRVKLQHYLRQVVNHILASQPHLTESPDKATFTTLLPFFSEMQLTQDGNSSSSSSSSRPRSSRRGVLSRLSGAQLEQAGVPDSPQYNGL